MENNQIKRFYIMPEVWATVTQSQVFNWIKLVNDNGISTDCISITSAKNTIENVKKFEESIGGKFIEVRDYKTLIINDLSLIIILLKYYFRNVFKFEKIIFQTRLTSLSYTYAFLRWLPKTKFVFDARGAYIVEREHVNKGKKKNLKYKIVGFLAKTSEKVMIKKADVIFSVSVALKKYYLENYNVRKDKFYIFPGAADDNLFFYKESLRNTIREEFNLDSNDILIGYSGSLKKKWEIPDKIFSFFEDLRKRDTNFKLLLITPDTDLANKLIKDFGLDKKVYVKKALLQNVNDYLNAADAGLLLREDVAMNNVASPTKFSEYLMAGLPVIVSKGVHDFSDNINETGYGVVVSGLGKISSEEYSELLRSLTINRSEIANWGLNNLSKSFFINKYVNILEKI